MSYLRVWLLLRLALSMLGRWDFRVRCDPKGKGWQGWGDSSRMWVVTFAGSGSRTAPACRTLRASALMVLVPASGLMGRGAVYEFLGCFSVQVAT